MPTTAQSHVSVYLAVLASAAWLNLVAGADPEPARTGIDWLDWATDQVAFAMREAEPADASADATVAETPEDPLAATHSIESIEIYRLQQEIRALRDLIEGQFITRIIALESELQEVKAAVQNTAIARDTPGAPRPRIPRPYDATDSDSVQAFMADPGESPALPGPADEPQGPSEPFSFSVVDEWGRSPDAVADLGGDAQTLIGMAGLVPPGSSKDDVVALARDLRAKYDAYDNINIEIFDSEAAAKEYASRQVADPVHHMASISRYKTGGRDVILWVGGGKAEPVPIATE